MVYLVTLAKTVREGSLDLEGKTVPTEILDEMETLEEMAHLGVQEIVDWMVVQGYKARQVNQDVMEKGASLVKEEAMVKMAEMVMLGNKGPREIRA